MVWGDWRSTASPDNRRVRRVKRGKRWKWLKHTAVWFVIFIILFSSATLLRNFVETRRPWENPYEDVSEELWSYDYIEALNKAGILPDQDALEPDAMENRGGLVSDLYRMDASLFPKEKKARDKTNRKALKALDPVAFSDVLETDECYEAVRWAYVNNLVSGTSDTTFGPEDPLTRQQVCTILARFAAMEKAELDRVVEPDQFVDSLYIEDYARSSVTACQMAGLISGYEDNYFVPEDNMARQECVTVLYRFMTAVERESGRGSKTVDFTPGAYDSFYLNYVDIPFTPLLAENPAGDPSFFDGTVFIGDSISLTLESYCNSTGALGDAKFLCAGSMSATNMLSGIILPEWPKGSGQKPAIGDSVAATGAKVVYIMLGMDNISYGIDRSTGDMYKVISSITERNPKVKIVVQSVTPMAEESGSYTEKLNNETIAAYNARMLELCEENKWYYLNVAEVMKDENGFLRRDYCSDYGRMGMHFTYDGAKVWVEYLKSHIPESLR